MIGKLKGKVDSVYDNHFIIDVNGNVGINTVAAIAAFDVVGNAAVTGAVRIYETDRSNYVGLQVGSLGSNLTFTLPTHYGTAGHVLYTDGTGTLAWKQVSNQEVGAGIGITISYATAGSGVTVATISNTGITSVTAGLGITVSYTGSSVEIAATSSGTSNLYPFTTRGFNIPF